MHLVNNYRTFAKLIFISTESFSKEENINVKQQKEKGGAKESCHICKLQWVELDRHSFEVASVGNSFTLNGIKQSRSLRERG